MRYAIACSAVIPLRPEPSEKTEMLTQIMFGEHVEIFDTTGNWAQVKNASDGYEGWIDKKTLVDISEAEFLMLCQNKNPFVFPELFGRITNERNSVYFISGGSILPEFNSNDLSFKIGTKLFHLEQMPEKKMDDPRVTIINTANKYINTPYLWGGKNPFGIDCSGLSQTSYKIAGINIARDASQQAKAGTPVNFLENTKPGDLAFFDNDEGVITHVGILLSQNSIIHASGTVRIDRIDHQGIFNNDLKKYTHKLRVIKDFI